MAVCISDFESRSYVAVLSTLSSGLAYPINSTARPTRLEYPSEQPLYFTSPTSTLSISPCSRIFTRALPNSPYSPLLHLPSQLSFHPSWFLTTHPKMSNPPPPTYIHTTPSTSTTPSTRTQVPLRDYLNTRIAPFLKKAITESLDKE
jgi:hypothetical protein